MKTALTIVGIICLVFLLIGAGYVVKAVLLPAKTVTTQIDSSYDVVEKTYDADNAIANYEWFKTQYEKIQANKAQALNAKAAADEYKEMYGDPKDWDFQTKSEYNRLNTITLGLKNQHESLVAEYNARSEMANRNIFKDKLPLSVDKMLW